MLQRPFVRALLAATLAWIAGDAFAGRIHPDLEARLRGKAAGDPLPVIVELEERVSAPTAAAAAPARDRRGRGRAIVQRLREIAERTQGPIHAELARESATDASDVKSLWVINGIALNASEKVIRALARRNDVREVRIDRSIAPPKAPRATSTPHAKSAAPVWNIEQIRAPQVWDLGYTGAGIVVGSFDTGVDGTHPDLAPNYRGNHAISWFDPYGRHAEPFDNNGHGTHTTGTMVASGEFSGFRIGVAPGARWIAAKGWRDNDTATASAFHRIFQWFLAPGGDSANAPDVVNMSWGLDPPSCDPEFVPDVQALRAAGIVPVFASGNNGPGASTTLAPGNYASAFSVGATDPVDEIAEFSSQGPSQCDGAVKPDVSAPGVAILSTLPGGIHFELDGTSMAAPHVSGAAAVLRSISPSLTVEEVETAIVDGSIDFGLPGMDNEFGAGRLDLLQSASLVLGMPLVGIGATTPTAQEAGTVPGRFTVTRKGSTTSDLVLPYTVSGIATAGSDYVALPGSVTIPAGSTSATITVTPIDDNEVELTETVIVTLTPSASYLASPATATVSIVSDEIPPDLVVASVTAPTYAGAGLPITITDTTRNQGAASSAPSVTGFYLSLDATLDAADVKIGTRAVPALAAGIGSTATTTFTLPAALATGTWYVIAKADDPEALVETQEANNVGSTTTRVGPDLELASFTAPTDAGAGLPLVLNDTTRNAGAGAAAASTTTFYLSIDGTLDASDAAIGSRAVPALAGSASSSASTAVTLPASLAPGTYTIFARADSADAIVELYENNNTRGAVVRVGPDLTVTGIAAPSTAGIGSPFTISDTTRNAGGGTASASSTRYYLSLDNVVDASDVMLGSRAVPSLAPGASSTGSASATIPAGTAGGSYYILALADADGMVAEIVETNNLQLRAILVGADLALTGFTAPSDAGAGLAITLGDTTTNQGAGTAAATTTSFYLSVDGVLDSGDTLLGSRAVPSLAANASSTGSVTVTLPAGLATGTYTLFALADSGNLVSEVSESNNRASRTLRIGPDLSISALTAPAAAGAGGTITVTDTTRNTGGGTAFASTTRIYLSTDATLDAGDALVGSRAVPSLAPGASDTGSIVASIPPTTPGGVYYLIAQADGGNAVDETQETNNTMVRSLLVGPDLDVSALTVPLDAGAGLAIAVTDTTRNSGGGAAPASTTSFFLSADATLDAGDVALGSRAVPALAAGGTSTGTTTVTIPAGIATGTWYLFARADASDAVAESYENNNVTSRLMRIGPDLVVSSLTVPATAGPGAPISVTDTTRNAGGGAAPASTTRYVLSVDGLPDAGDVVLGARVVPALGPGASDTATVTLTIPPDTAGGSYYVVAISDADGVVPETAENNNFNNRSIVIGTDLVVSSFVTPTDGGAGFALTVTDTTRNQGAGTAAPSTTSYYLSANPTYEATDTLLGSRAVGALGPGATDTGSVSLAIPAGTATGDWYLLARADSGGVVSELNESNNVAFRSLRVGPDLVISSVGAPNAAGAGDTITVTVSTRNAGAGTAPGSTTYVYFSLDWQLSANDVLLATRAVPDLAPGSTDIGTVTVTLPADAPGGTRYLIAVADGAGAVSETQEVNNTTYRSVLVGADLDIASFTVPTAGGAGLTLTLTDTTRNSGGGTAPASTTSYYLSRDGYFDAADVMLGSRAVPSLAAGATSTGSVTVTIPADAATGNWNIFAVADAGAVVSETYENNNATSRAIGIGPDLQVPTFTAPSAATPGGTISVTDETRNLGGGAAAASTTRYLLSTDGLPSAGDIVLATRPVPSLAPGTSDIATVALTIPPGTATGWWYVIAVADGDGVVAETIETNNFRNKSVYVSP